MSYAVRKDGSGWRSVLSSADCSSDEIWQALAPLPKVINPRIAEIRSMLISIDQKKIRATTDAILGSDKTRLQALETQAAELRAELATL